MSFFARKPDPDMKLPGESEPTPRPTAPQPAVTTAGAATVTAPRGYGVAEVILLMRSLPIDQNVDLVVRVVTKTLASLGIRIGDVIADATRRQHVIQERIGALKTQIAELEREAEVRRQEIGRLETDLRETNLVRDRLSTAERAQTTPGPVATAPAPAPGFTPATQGSRGGRAIAVSDGVATVVKPDPNAAAAAPSAEEQADGPPITFEEPRG